MNPKFVVSHLDQQLGPFSEQELKAKWSKGELLPIDYVYDELKKDWVLLAERFEWTAGRKEGTPPPLKPMADKKKTPPTQNTTPQTLPAATAAMVQQKPAESTIIVPVLNLPQVQNTTVAIGDPMPTPTTLPVIHNQPPAVSTPKTFQPAQVKIVNGVGVLDLSPEAPGHVEFILQNASAANLKLQEPLKIQVRPLEPEEVMWSFPLQPTVGNEFEILVKAVDGKGTVCSHFEAEFSIRTGGSEPRTHAMKLKDGQASLKIANTKAEKWEISFLYNGARSLRLPEVKTVEWMPGPAARLILDGPPDLVAGNPLKVQVKAVDQYGNLASSFQGTVVLEVKAS